MLPYRIAFIGNNRELTICGFFQFIHNNSEQVLRIDKINNIVQLKDGTIIQAVTKTDLSHIKGSMFDQLILFDNNDSEIELCTKRHISDVLNRMNTSAIPREFQIIRYENIPIGRSD